MPRLEKSWQMTPSPPSGSTTGSKGRVFVWPSIVEPAIPVPSGVKLPPMPLSANRNMSSIENSAMVWGVTSTGPNSK